MSVRENGSQGIPVVSDRIWTVPNVLSLLRLVGVPFFFVLILARHDVAAIVLLAIASVTDYLDGKIARRFKQVTKLGQMLDPAADRLYIFATVLGLTIREIIPWWMFAVLLGRDLLMVVLVPALRSRGFMTLPVNFIGKSGTFCLLYALPLILLGDVPWALSAAADVLGWAFALWGIFCYWWAGLIYVKQTFDILSTTPAIKQGEQLNDC